MKIKKESKFIDLPKVKLYLEDLEDICQILDDEDLLYEITLDEYELESIKELEKITKKQEFKCLEIKIKDKKWEDWLKNDRKLNKQLRDLVKQELQLISEDEIKASQIIRQNIQAIEEQIKLNSSSTDKHDYKHFKLSIEDYYYRIYTSPNSDYLGIATLIIEIFNKRVNKSNILTILKKYNFLLSIVYGWIPFIIWQFIEINENINLLLLTVIISLYFIIGYFIFFKSKKEDKIVFCSKYFDKVETQNWFQKNRDKLIFALIPALVTFILGTFIHPIIMTK